MKRLLCVLYVYFSLCALLDAVDMTLILIDDIGYDGVRRGGNPTTIETMMGEVGGAAAEALVGLELIDNDLSVEALYRQQLQTVPASLLLENSLAKKLIGLSNPFGPEVRTMRHSYARM